MAKRQRTYTREFKIEAVRLLERSGESQRAIADQLGISSSNLSRWKKKYDESGEDAFPGHGKLTPERERIRQLKRELEIVRQERDILRIALAIFSEPDK